MSFRSYIQERLIFITTNTLVIVYDCLVVSVRTGAVRRGCGSWCHVIRDEFSHLVIGRKLLRRRIRDGTWRAGGRRIVAMQSGRRRRRRTTVHGAAGGRCRYHDTPRPGAGVSGTWTRPPLPAVGVQGLQEEEHERRPA